ncbi:MAG: hypothetical protein QXV81_08825 [Ignisphaera sp.]
MKVEEMDLRNIPSTCTSHPVVVLSNKLSEISRRNVDEIRIYINLDDIPINAMEFFLSRYNYCIKELKNIDGKSVFIIARRGTE